MKKGTFFSIVALLVSIVGVTVAVAAYMKRRSCVLCDDIDEDMFMDDDCDCCECDDACDDSCECEKEECSCDSQPKESDTNAASCCDHCDSEETKAE